MTIPSSQGSDGPGNASLEKVDGIVPEYALAATRYFGEVQGAAWVKQMRQMVNRMIRISVRA
jgi:hypothetical protein